MPTRNPTKKPAEKAKNPPASWSGIARDLHCSRQSIQRWRERDDAPSEPDFARWKNYIRENSLGKASGSELSELKAQLLREQIASQRRRNQRENRELLPVAELGECVRAATTCWQHALQYLLEQGAPPRLVGKDIAELRAELLQIHDELVERYTAELAKIRVEDLPNGE